MRASVYVKGNNIHFYNEGDSFFSIGGLAYELGKPLLDFVCYEPEQFSDGFNTIAEMFDNEFAHIGAKEPEFIAGLSKKMSELQQKEIYLSFYAQIFLEFIYSFIDSPQMAIEQLSEIIPNTKESLAWVSDYKWAGKTLPDTEKRLFRAAKDVVALLYNHLCEFQKFIIHEIEVLLHYRREIEVPAGRSIDYIDILDEYHDIEGYTNYYLERPFNTFYGRVATKEVEQLYVIDSVEDLFRLGFIKMIEQDIFIKKCKNCERFFIPRRRADAEYCDRIFGDNGRKCSEVGATLRYEKKVAGNPILEAHKKAYRRLNSRTRMKKITQAEFLKWSEEASTKRDECLAGSLPFDDFVAWLEQGRIRKSRSESLNATNTD